MGTYLLTWNPERWAWESFEDDQARVGRGLVVEMPWSTGNTKRVDTGDRLFLLRQGPRHAGLIGAGRALIASAPSPHYDAQRRAAGESVISTLVRLETLLSLPNVLPTRVLRDDPVLGEFGWRPAASGFSIPSPLDAALDARWRDHLESVGTRALSPHARFRAMLEEALRARPYETECGAVMSWTEVVGFGHPGGNHEPTTCWRYQHRSAGLDMLFGFYRNFSPNDLICKVVTARGKPAPGEGASIQLNGDESVFVSERDDLVLRHHGLLTVGTRLARTDLLALIIDAAPSEARVLGIADEKAWPFRIGLASRPAALLDRLFDYTFVIEQAKRRRRGEPALERADARAWVRGEVSQTGQAYSTDPEVRRAVELHAMRVVEEHLRRERYDVENTSAHACFDFRAVRGREVLTVEVKGTVGDGSSVLLTRNEVEHARAHTPDVMLAIVSDIEIVREPRVAARGGVLRLITPWDPDEHLLLATTYRCQLRMQVPE